MKQLTHQQAATLLLQGETLWTPINCECCEEDKHYTTIESSQGDTTNDLIDKELFI